MILDPTRRHLLSGMALGFVPASAVAAPSAKAQPAGNLHDVGLFSSASGRAAAGAAVVQTSGYSAVGEGAARYIYDEAVDAAYVAAHPRVSFRAADGRGFRLDPQQRLTIQMFGGRADGATNNSARLGTYGATDNALALNAALTFISSNEIISGSNLNYRGGAAIHFPAADGVYDFASTVNIKTTVQITGDSGSGVSGVPSSVLRWPPGMHGIIVHETNTMEAGTVATSNWAGGGTVIEGVGIYQHETGNSLHTEDYHGVWMRNRATIRNFVINGFSGNGLHIVGSIGSGGVTEGNTNSFRVENGMIYNCEHGVFVDGGDANAGHIQGVDATANRGYGIWDSSFLGNTLIANHTSDNGVYYRNNNAKTATVSHGGYEWYVMHGVDLTAASTTEPGTDAGAYWRRGALSGPSLVHPAWVSGMTLRYGGGYCLESAAAHGVAVGCYAEGGQGGNFAAAGNVILGGDVYYGWYGGGTFLTAGGGIGSFSTPIEWKRKDALGVDKFRSRLGGQADGLDEILHIEDSTRIGTLGTEYLRLSWAGVTGQANWKDLVFTKGNPALNRHAFRITTPNTDERFGRSTTQPLTFATAELAIGSRIHQSGPAAPTTGYHAKGEVCWNDHTDPASDAVDYWICKTAGEGAAATWIARP